ncbi:MFS transporter [Frankia sp. R82]|uniref:MFS transporter n=1 Tax=Frankia sp. R82 TaxID=2950553 RepID=UPI002042DA85|nr:MFS transporter [Frankia sp. R82]MCM3883842.1 MFS transporter [Frankia sp. R82]
MHETTTVPAAVSSRRTHRVLDRRLARYPGQHSRLLYLAITVVVTVMLYYELYVGGSVATQVIAEFGFTFTEYILILVVGSALGACASLLAGLADRWGRANLIIGGLLLTGLLVALGVPHAPNKLVYAIVFAALSIVEGIVLVATPALVRDFSPQVGRGAAMGFWTLGPVLGSLVASVVSSRTLGDHPDWRFQFHVCGIAGLVVFAVAFVGLRELTPGLRNQLMVNLKDRTLVEARAAGLDAETARHGHWRQMLRLDIVGPALAIALFLVLYYIVTGFQVVYFVTVHGYTEQKANALANWYWLANAVVLVGAGVLSDRLRVRKPLMVGGALVCAASTAVFAVVSRDLSTSYYTFALIFVVAAVGGGTAYVAWMAAFTETAERRNPAATATGLAIWGWTVRAVVAVSYVLLLVAVPATSTLIDHGQRAQEIQTRYPAQVATISAVDPTTLAALQRNTRAPEPAVLLRAETQIVAAGLAPDNAGALQRLLQLTTQPIPANDIEYLGRHGAEVRQALRDNPRQWARWWWICFATQLAFLPCVFVLTGRWSPRKARHDESEHERRAQRELAALQRLV